jgi:CBS domain-containing protein
MRVEDVMTRDVVSVTSATSLREVARVLAEHGISGVPVLRGDEVVGVVSESDIVAKVGAAEEPGPGVLHPLLDRELRARLDARVASAVMATPPVTVEPWMSAAAAAWLMVEDDVNRLPVVENGRLVGIVTRADIVRAFARRDAEIGREIREEVLPSLGLSAEDVRVVVEAGTVQLEGEVPAGEEEAVVHAIMRVVGVVSVHDELNAARRPVGVFD